MKHNKLVFILVMVFLISCVAVEAGRIGDMVEGYFTKAWNFEVVYDKNPRLWDFVLFALIFNMIAWIGLANMFKENKVTAYIFSIVLGVALGLASVKAGMSMSFFIPFVKNAMFFIVAGIIFYILYKMGINKVLAGILALVITFVMFNVFGLFGAVDVSDIGETIKGQFQGEKDLEGVNTDIGSLSNKYIRINDRAGVWINLTDGEKDALRELGITGAITATELLKGYLKLSSVADKMKFIELMMGLAEKFLGDNPDSDLLTREELLQDTSTVHILKGKGETLEREKEVQMNEAVREKFEDIIDKKDEIKKATNAAEKKEKLDELINMVEGKLNEYPSEESK